MDAWIDSDVRPAHAFAATTPEEHAAWAGELRAVVRRLASFPDHVGGPLRRTTGRRAGLVVEDVVLPSIGRYTVSGRLLRVEDVTNVPAVVLCPGRNATVDELTGYAAPPFPDADLGIQLAARGIASLTLDYGIVDRRPAESVAGRDEVNLLGLALGLTGHSVLGLLIAGAASALAWLEAEPWVAEDRVGIVGRSLGGSVALHAALARRHPVPVALAACLGRYRTMFDGRLSAGAAHALPRILRYADLPDLVAALAPSPLHLQHGVRDEVLPIADAESALAIVRASYGVVADDALDVHVHPGGHSVDVDRLCDFLLALEPAATRRRSVPAARVVFTAGDRAQILDRIDQSLTTGELTLGRHGRRLETLARRHTGAAHVAAVASGTGALEIACRIAGVDGRTVLIPANTFFATAGAVMHAGGRIEFVDCEPTGLGMDPDRLAAALRDRSDVAAVVVVHIGGIVAPSLATVATICHEHGIPLIEDAAHALGSRLDGRPAGSLGRVGAFSMYPTKIATSGEGGLVATQAADDDEIARCLRDQGKLSFTSNVHASLGGNWRMSEPHAAIGIAHLERLDEFVLERQRLAARYDELLSDCSGIRPLAVPAGSSSNYYKYLAHLDEDVDRGDLRRALRSDHGIALAGEVYERPCFAQPFFADRYRSSDFPVASRFCARHVALPLYQAMSEREQQAVVAAIASVLAAQQGALGVCSDRKRAS